ncbi:MAG TPA: acetylxylan esterase [Sunxiuqinia sp.]|nr:acetylxylan esterase [Sunxiuqinia sp.]
MKYIASIILFCMVGILTGKAQNADTHYEKSLKETLDKVESRFSVKLDYSNDLVKDKVVPYADWRFRSDLKTTLMGILGLFDYVYEKQDDGSYKITKFRYSRRPVEEGRKDLQRLLSLYTDSTAFKVRRKQLRKCMMEALQLSPMPKSPGGEPIITNKRKMNGYTIENMAIETLPGLYVCGSLYQPAKVKGKIPVILTPNGHFKDGRYRKSEQIRCANLARMGAMVMSYDLFAWGESQLQFKSEDHKRSLTQSIQALNSMRILDYLLSLKHADKSRVGMTGGSGGGTETLLITALDDRIKVSVPVVMVSSYFYGGCPGESGQPVHLCGGGTNNAEFAAMAAPDPQLVISDGHDWTSHVPEIEFPYLQEVYALFGKEENVQNVHLVNERHNYGESKRLAMYPFMAKYLGLDLRKIEDENGQIDESNVTIEPYDAMFVFGKNGENLPANAIHGFDKLQELWKKVTHQVH